MASQAEYDLVVVGSGHRGRWHPDGRWLLASWAASQEDVLSDSALM